MKSGYAPLASRNSPVINTRKNDIVPVSVRQIIGTGELKPVYNLEVENENEYYANGVLVHNCDMTRYTVAYVDRGKTSLPKEQPGQVSKWSEYDIEEGSRWKKY